MSEAIALGLGKIGKAYRILLSPSSERRIAASLQATKSWRILTSRC
jgi:hypothetical protein